MPALLMGLLLGVLGQNSSIQTVKVSLQICESQSELTSQVSPEKFWQNGLEVRVQRGVCLRLTKAVNDPRRLGTLKAETSRNVLK